ncbi:spore germination protein GerPE [Priestia filamentosa]|nr:spore germination protein GerPE [Priestia filamentosa]
MRTSKVDWFRMNSLTSSSIFNIGDSAHIRSSAKVIAIQREAELFLGREGNFNDYTLFKRSYPLLTLKRIPTVKYNESNIIHVGSVRVTGASTSSVVHTGNLINTNTGGSATNTFDPDIADQTVAGNA